ncbi:MAG: hypothetical protein CSB48_10810 [Proteobacteria bacterium]|nr:MAG: hypothetical protein CSB48_10810 [Pseudomonadota bacterium]PIE40033.1 MAG: hypothetical protein CSA51_02575 [Gammaproteobacteria bacterium]
MKNNRMSTSRSSTGVLNMRLFRKADCNQSCCPVALLLPLLLLLLLLCLPARATLDKEQIEAGLEQLAKNTALSESRKTGLTNQLATILKGLQQVEEFERQTADYRESTSQLPDQIRQIEQKTKRLERHPPNTDLTINDNEPIEKIEQRLADTISQQTTLETQLSRLQEQLTARQNRPQQIRQQLSSLPRFDLSPRFRYPGVSPETKQDLGNTIKRWQSELQTRLVESQTLALEAELAHNPVLLDFINAEIDLLQHRLEIGRGQIVSLEKTLANRRVKDADEFRKKAVKAEQNIANKTPIITNLATKNLSLSNELRNIAEKLAKVNQHGQSVSETIQHLRDDFSATRKKIEVAGLSQAMGQVLLEDRRRIAAISLNNWLKLTSEQRLSEIGLKRIQYEEERRSLRNVAGIISQMTKNTPQSAEVDKELHSLLENRKTILDRVIASEQKHLRALGNLDYSVRELVSLMEKYQDFITKHLLWVKSSQAVNIELLSQTPEQLVELLSLSRLHLLAGDLRQILVTNSLATGIGIVALLVLVSKRKVLISALSASARPLKRLTTDSFNYTLRALLLSVVLASPLPLTITLFALAIQSSIRASHLLTDIGAILPPVALQLFFVQLIRQSCRSDGLLRVHFKWTGTTVDQIKLAMDKLLYLFIPAMLLSLILLGYDFGTLSGALPHLSFLVTMVLSSYCLLSTLLKQRETKAARSDTRSTGKLFSTALGYFFLFTPLLFGLAGLAGYLYTVGTLCLKIMDTFGLVIVLILIHQLVIRWLTLASRQLAYKNALERRAAARQKAQESSAEASATDSLLEVEEPKIDIDAVSKGAKELLNTGLAVGGAIGFWLIWADILPAFSILDEFTLWHYTRIEDGREIDHAVSLFNLGLSVFIITVTFIAAKRLPALLEFMLLPYMKNNQGGLYTTRTLLGYLIVAIGFLVVLNRMGASWTQLQWLAAALSVGIGFGLQEIVANFISGLIILFERPIRVGDVVTVGDTDGVVTRIKIRATTIRNWDHKELLVPNKEFITSRLLNWTLSDQTTRLIITAGVAYGSDVEKAMTIMARLAQDHPQVLPDPAPTVYFESLGDNALIITLRAFVAKNENRMSTLSELHLAIYNALNEAEIPISYPQRDVHLDTTQPLDIRVNPGYKSEPGNLMVQASPEPGHQ